MWATAIVVRYPFSQDPPQMPFIQWNAMVKTLAGRPNQPLAERIRLRTAHGRF